MNEKIYTKKIREKQGISNYNFHHLNYNTAYNLI